MAYNFVDQIIYQGKKSNFERDAFKTKADMKRFNENYLPDVFIAVCYEDGNVYIFNRNNEVDEETGRWRVLEGGGDSKTKKKISASYAVGGINEGDEIAAGVDLEDILRKMLEGEKQEGVISYYGTSATKITDLTALTKVETLPNFTISVTANNEYIIIACPNDKEVSIFSNGFDYTTSFTKTVTSAYTFYYSEAKITCRDFSYNITYI